jgi:uncharacterized protein YegL
MSEDLISRLEYEDNTSQRTPCVLVLDASGSMSGASIEALNSGLKRREKELKEDVVARNRVPILAIRVGGDAREMGDWADAANFVAPTLIADGGTPLGVGMDLALQKVAEEKRLLDGAGIPSTRPWIFMISDGYPTDEGWERAADRCVLAEREKRAIIFPIAVEAADRAKLGRFSARPVKLLDGLQFSELFLWLSRSLSAASQSAPGQAIQLPADSWSRVEA